MFKAKKGSAAGKSSFLSFVVSTIWVATSLVVIFGGNLLIGYEIILLGRDSSEIGDGIRHVALLTDIPVKALWINAFFAIILDLLMYLSSLRDKKKRR